MLGRIVDLTWSRPRLVLAVVATLAVVAGVFGLGVEKHLKAAGFTDAASESERATSQLRESLGYDASLGLVVLVRPRDGGLLNPRAPAVGAPRRRGGAIPLGLGVLSILGTFPMLRVMSGLVDTSLFALNIATALSLGLAVDYALLLVSRYREEIAREGPPRAAHRRTVITAGRAALLSGFEVAAAMASLIAMPQRFLYSLGAAGAAVGLFSALLAVLVVPALLRLAGTRINALSVRRGLAVADQSDGWYRLARGVMRRPLAVALISTGALLAVSAPGLGTVLTGPNAEAVPDSQPSYRANTYVERHYPATSPRR